MITGTAVHCEKLSMSQSRLGLHVDKVSGSSCTSVMASGRGEPTILPRNPGKPQKAHTHTTQADTLAWRSSLQKPIGSPSASRGEESSNTSSDLDIGSDGRQNETFTIDRSISRKRKRSFRDYCIQLPEAFPELAKSGLTVIGDQDPAWNSHPTRALSFSGLKSLVDAHLDTSDSKGPSWDIRPRKPHATPSLSITNRKSGNLESLVDSEISFESYDPLDDTLEIHNLTRHFSSALPESAFNTSSSQTAQCGPRSDPELVTRRHQPWISTSYRGSVHYGQTRLAPRPTNQTLHCDLSYLEVLQLQQILHIAYKSSSLQDLAHLVNQKLPHRSIHELLAFSQERGLLQFQTSTDRKSYTQGSTVEVIAVSDDERIHRRKRFTASTTSTLRRELGKYHSHVDITSFERHVKPYRVFRGTSGDVNAGSFSPNGENVLVGCIATSDEYNRDGNLTMIRTGVHDGQTTCHLLDGKNRSSNRFPTISSIAYVRNGQYFMVGGADETLKVYSAKGRFLHDKSRKNRVCTHDIATSSRFSDIAVTCHSSGHLDIHKFRSSGVSDSYGFAYHDRMAPTVATFDDYHKQLIVGYTGQDSKSIAGQAAIIDLETMTQIGAIKGDVSYAHLAVSQEGQWVAGTNTDCAGIVRLHDSRTPELVIREFSNDQGDINEVTIRENLITSAATDGTCHVWDIRTSVSGRPLHILKQGVPKQPLGTTDVCGTTGTSFFGRSRFVTAGSDGCVKLWDLGLSDPWLKDLVEVASPITRLCLSSTRDQMMVGENRGDIHLWSLRGDGVEQELIEERLQR